jgi:hypothetical protein
MATLAITPASGSITSTKDFTKVVVAAATVNDSSNYSASTYPTEPAFTYYLTFELGGSILGKSYVFTPDSTGGHEFDNYVFPSAGAWTVRLSNAATAGSVATLAVTVA